MAQIVARGTLLYLGSVNVGSAVLFGFDKVQAQRGEWRVSEKALCRSAIYGGWAGGLVAMQLLRHKTRKKSFQEKYVAAIGKNFVGLALALFIVTRSPRVRSAFHRDLRGMFGGSGGGGGRVGRGRRR